MKNNFLLLPMIILTAFLVNSCEDVVDVNLSSARPRLVVEASIDWQKGFDGSWQYIRLSTSTGYYSNYIPDVSGAEVSVINSSGDVFMFNETVSNTNDIYYICENFAPEMGETYTLQILYNNEIYNATETMLPVPDLLYAEQTTEGFTDDQLVIKAFFEDPPGDNYYMHAFLREDKAPKYAVFDDKFTDGNLNYTVRIFDDLNRSDAVGIRLYGVSRRYYDYLGKILTTTSEGNIGPFQVAPAELRGNVTNITNPDNYAYGYFRLSEMTEIEYIVE